MQSILEVVSTIVESLTAEQHMNKKKLEHPLRVWKLNQAFERKSKQSTSTKHLKGSKLLTIRKRTIIMAIPFQHSHRGAVRRSIDVGAYSTMHQRHDHQQPKQRARKTINSDTQIQMRTLTNGTTRIKLYNTSGQRNNQTQASLAASKNELPPPQRGQEPIEPNTFIRPVLTEIKNLNQQNLHVGVQN